MMVSKNEGADQGNSEELPVLYRFLALAMNFPDSRWAMREVPAALVLLLQELGWQPEAEAIRLALAQGPGRLETLQVEHTRLFVNAFPKVIAPPYASLYLDQEPALYGASAEKVRACYREHGLDLAGPADIPDHLCLELEFLARLAEDGEDEAESRFLAHHFRPWFARFKRRVMHEGIHPFYPAVIRLIEFFTREEQDYGSEVNEAQISAKHEPGGGRGGHVWLSDRPG